MADQAPEAVMKEIRRKTRRKFTAEKKMRIVLKGLKGTPASQSCSGER